MSIRWRNGRPIVEIYDPATKRKQHVKAADYGQEPPAADASERTWQRFAERLERAALQRRDQRRAGARDESCESFATRWPDDYVRGKGGRERGRSTIEHNRERVRSFGREFADRPLRSVERTESRAWAAKHPGTVPALRAMFKDAIDDDLADSNPFAKLGLAQRRGREDIIVLTLTELAALTELARRLFGGEFGDEVAAMITWAAYTCTRPGETFAARYSLLDGDVYDLRRQFNSKLGEETRPKNNSTGLIYVPEPAQRAVLDKPRRLGDDLMFRTSPRRRQWRHASWQRIWDPIRRAFAETLPETHHLRERIAVDAQDQLDFYELRHFGASYMLNDLELEPWIIAEQLRHGDGGALVLQLYGHPDRRKAIDRIRRAYTGAAVTPIRGTDDQAKPARRGKVGGQ